MTHPFAPVSFAAFGSTVTSALLRIALPMAVTGLLATFVFAMIGRLNTMWSHPRVGDPMSTNQRNIFLVLCVIPIAMTVWGLIDRVQDIPESGFGYFLSLLAGTLAVGYTEEIIFRGFLLQEARRYYRSEWKAAMLVAVMFGAWHLPNIFLGPSFLEVMVQFAQTIVIGLLFYVVRVVFGHIWPAVLVHAGWDFALL
ncbi:hypothetical protein KEM60_00608 [Austwickia sp. TVS 96-490-7B]|nr:hypothetical protein [Austwickia sp. TVS 96-490-7B]